MSESNVLYVSIDAGIQMYWIKRSSWVVVLGLAKLGIASLISFRKRLGLRCWALQKSDYSPPNFFLQQLIYISFFILLFHLLFYSFLSINSFLLKNQKKSENQKITKIVDLSFY